MVDTTSLAWVSFSVILFLAAVVKFLFYLHQKYQGELVDTLSRIEKIYLCVFSSLVLLYGLFPQFLLKGILAVLQGVSKSKIENIVNGIIFVTSPIRNHHGFRAVK